MAAALQATEEKVRKKKRKEGASRAREAKNKV